MTTHWYAQTKAWASVSKAKRNKRKAKRAVTTFAPRGRTSHVHQDVREAMLRVQQPLDIHALAGRPSREPGTDD